MNPIPLSAPDGRVYAYACGRCHRVADGGYQPRAAATGPSDDGVDGSFRAAGGCCLCSECRIVTDALIVCNDCMWWWKFGAEWKEIAGAIRRGLLTWEQWCDRASEDDE